MHATHEVVSFGIEHDPDATLQLGDARQGPDLCRCVRGQIGHDQHICATLKTRLLATAVQVCRAARQRDRDLDFTLDIEGLRQNIHCQSSHNMAGIVVLGTTGESPVISADEREVLISFIFQPHITALGSF